MSFRFNRFFFVSFFLVFVSLAIHNASAVEIGVTFNSSTDKRVVGYNLYYGTSKNSRAVIDLGAKTGHRFSDLQPGETYYFALKAYDQNKKETDYSNVLVYTMPDESFSDSDANEIKAEEELSTDDPLIISLGEGRCGNSDFDRGSDEVADYWEKSAKIMEIGEIAVDHNWTRVAFDSTFVEPIVVAKPASSNDPDPGIIRVQNISKEGFDIRIQDWNYLDGYHDLEKVAYLVMEKGSYILPGGIKIEAGSFKTGADGFKAHSFIEPFNNLPVVATTITSVNNAENPVNGRNKNVGIDGFEFCLQERETAMERPHAEIVSYIAWEPSSGTFDGIDYEVSRTGNHIDEDTNRIVYFGEPFSAVPSVIADMQTFKGSDTLNLRYIYKNENEIALKFQEEQPLNGGRTQLIEEVGYFAFSAEKSMPSK